VHEIWLRAWLLSSRPICVGRFKWQVRQIWSAAAAARFAGSRINVGAPDRRASGRGRGRTRTRDRPIRIWHPYPPRDAGYLRTRWRYPRDRPCRSRNPALCWRSKSRPLNLDSWVFGYSGDRAWRRCLTVVALRVCGNVRRGPLATCLASIEHLALQ